MRVVAVVLALAGGCTQTQARKAHRAGEVATAGGLIGVLTAGVVASLVPAHEETIMNVGLAFVPISVLGALVYIATDGKVNEESAAPAMTRRERNRAAAWELTKQAAGAARDQDCTQVQAIDPRVRDLDVEFHVSVFMRDVAIQRCLRAR
ncbi:MAG TPA: hypothetical protein VIV40_18245 [Kofleriaceae bacterium]